MPENPEPGHEPPQFRRRVLAEITLADGTEVVIAHLYPPDKVGCPGCGGDCVSAGLVSLEVDDPNPWMSPEEALLIANRLARGANLVLETLEDAPDVQREAARFGAVPDYPPDEA